MKTEFEEVYSKIMHTDFYEKDKIIFWYLGDRGLQELFLDDVIQYIDRMFKIASYKDGDYVPVFIPTYRIYMVTYGGQIIMDRRSGYNGYKNMELPENFPEEFGF